MSFRLTGPEILEWQRVRPLLFGVYAWPEKDGALQVEEAGSGILIAQEHGLTARHVVQSFTKIDPRVEDRRRGRPYRGRAAALEYTETEIPTIAYQESAGDQRVEWTPRIVTQSPETDIAVMAMSPLTPSAEVRARSAEYLEWQLLPPPLGAKVRVYACPEPAIRVDGHMHEASVNFMVRPARVVHHAPVLMEHGFRHFPGYVVDQELPGGASGGAVVYNGRLAGVFTGPSYVSALWPLLLLQHLLAPDLTVSFADHFEHGVIRAVDWSEVKGRVKLLSCDEALAGSGVEGRCLGKHVALSPSE